MPLQELSHDVPALVLEGGGFRGMFTAGVLDVLMEKGCTDFASVWGVSAGALNAISFKSKQIGRTMRIMLAFRDDKRFMSWWSLINTGDIAGGEFVYDTIQNELDPCDIETFENNPLPMYAVVSDVTFGVARYEAIEKLPEDSIKVRASASLPGVSQIVEVDGHRYLDGGTTDSVPFATALGLPETRIPEGYTPASKAVVILTQHRDYVKSSSSEQIALRSHRYDGYPYFIEALKNRADRYNAQRKELWDLEREGRCFVIAPPEPVQIRHAEHAGAPLLSLYLQGRQTALDQLATLTDFMQAD